jgi:hypothetical protein
LAEQVAKLLEDGGLPVRRSGTMIALTEQDGKLLEEQPRQVELVCLNCNGTITKTTVPIADGYALSFDILQPRTLTCRKCGNNMTERIAYRVI